MNSGQGPSSPTAVKRGTPPVVQTHPLEVQLPWTGIVEHSRNPSVTGVTTSSVVDGVTEAIESDFDALQLFVVV
jgi:hypothetical protein